MDSEQIRSLIRARPFRPFVLVFRDGRRFPVRHAYHLGMDQRGKLACVSTAGESFHLFDPLRVQIVEWLDGPRETGMSREASS